jgi:hypothetical protein
MTLQSGVSEHQSKLSRQMAPRSFAMRRTQTTKLFDFLMNSSRSAPVRVSTITDCQRVSYRELGPHKRHELLTGEIVYAVVGYSGYGDGKSGDLTDSISDEMRADWANNREALLKFWASGEPTTARIFPDSKPWLFVCGSPDTLPWAERQFSGY